MLGRPNETNHVLSSGSVLEYREEQLGFDGEAFEVPLVFIGSDQLDVSSSLEVILSQTNNEGMKKFIHSILKGV